MNKEEKEAIEIVESFKVDSGSEFWLGQNGIWAIKTLLNLIEKQRKEIQQLRNKLEFDYVEAHYIDKDKIREKIKELKKQQEENRNEFSKGIDCLNLKLIDDVSTKICINFSVRSILEGILEENNNE